MKRIRAFGSLIKMRRMWALGLKTRIRGVIAFGQIIRIIRRRANRSTIKVRRRRAFGQIITIIRAKNKSLVTKGKTSPYALREQR